MIRLSRQNPRREGVHPGRLVDQVEAGKTCHDVRVGLLVAGLHVGHLRVGNSGGRTAGKAIEPVHLCAAGGQQRLLARPA